MEKNMLKALNPPIDRKSSPPKQKSPSALKHGAYARTILLPGENAAALERLHERLITEFAPVGELEEHTVATLARLLWRRQRLAVYRRAERARGSRDRFRSAGRSLRPRLQGCIDQGKN